MDWGYFCSKVSGCYMTVEENVRIRMKTSDEIIILVLDALWSKNYTIASAVFGEWNLSYVYIVICVN